MSFTLTKEETRNKRSFEEPSNSVRKLPPHKMAKASLHDFSSFKMIATLLLPSENSCWQVYNLDLGCHLSHGLKGEEFQANVQAELHIKEGWPKHPRNSVSTERLLFFLCVSFRGKVVCLGFLVGS